MTDNFCLEYLEGYIHIRAYGKKAVDTNLNYWKKAALACTFKKCNRILVEDYMEGELSTLEILSILERLPQTGLSRETKIGIVAPHFGVQTYRPIAQSASDLRGWAIRYFADIASAKNWLCVR
jgi:hypothetical protein